MMQWWRALARGGAIGVLVLCGASAARAQGKPQGEPSGAAGNARPGGKTARVVTGSSMAGTFRVGLEVGLRVEFGLPLGTAYDDPASFVSEDYSDMFGMGRGFGLTLFVPFDAVEPSNPDFDVSFGPMFSFSLWKFPGDDITDGNGDNIDPDDMDITTIMFGVGMRWAGGERERPVRFLGGVDVLLGLANYAAVDAVYDQTPTGGAAQAAKLFDSTSGAFAFSMVVRGGADIKLTPRVSLQIMALFGWTFMGAPDDADPNPLPPAGAETLFNIQFGLTVTVTVRFGGTAAMR